MTQKDPLLDHNYDGIQEYDNDLPKWWVQLFWLTTILGVVYAVWFHMPSTPTPEQRLASSMEALKALNAESSRGTSASELMNLVSNSTALAEGKAVYASKCAVCHGEGGQGVIGPNLTDDYWIHGGKIEQIDYIVREGVIEKGMLSWKSQLPAEQLAAVVAYVYTLYGSNPANPKAPEGKIETRE
jgi:cytochrome c oxidase cbb3-type subunit 3